MALKRAMKRSETKCRKDFPDGYFKIVKIEQMNNGKVRVQLQGFADEQARRYDGNSVQSPSPMMNENHSWVMQKEIEISESELVQPTDVSNMKPMDILKSSVYYWLKQTADFNDAVDC